MAAETQICKICKKELPLTRFTSSWYKRDQIHRYRKECKDCFNKGQRKRHKDNPRSWEKTRRTCYLRWRFGITQEDYNEMFSRQNGVCAICGQPETAMRKGKLIHLAIDHDHKTGTVRELLCSKCNKALGLLDEDEDRCRSMVAYIQKHKER